MIHKRVACTTALALAILPPAGVLAEVGSIQLTVKELRIVADTGTFAASLDRLAIARVKESGELAPLPPFLFFNEVGRHRRQGRKVIINPDGFDEEMVFWELYVITADHQQGERPLVMYQAFRAR